MFNDIKKVLYRTKKLPTEGAPPISPVSDLEGKLLNLS